MEVNMKQKEQERLRRYPKSEKTKNKIISFSFHYCGLEMADFGFEIALKH